MSDSYETPAAIAAGIRSGDKNAETALVKKYSRTLLYVLEKRTADSERAKDLCQDTLQLLLEKLRKESINEPDKLGAYIQRTAINLFIAEERKARRRKTYTNSELIDLHAAEDANQLHDLVEKRTQDSVRKYISELDNDRDRLILYRYYVDEADKAEVCSELELSRRHFDRVISRARTRLKKLIESRGDESVLEAPL